MLLRTSSSGEELELFVFLEEELGLSGLSLGAPLHEEMTAEQRGRLYEWLMRSFGVTVPKDTRDSTFYDIIELMQTRPRKPDPAPVSYVEPPSPAPAAAAAPSAAATAASVAPPVAKRAVRLLSYNVNYAFCRNGRVGTPEQAVVAAIRAAKADVVLLQETHASWRTHLGSCGFDALYPHRWWHDDNEASGGLALYSKLPIVWSQLLETPMIEQGSWFPAAMHIVLTGQGPVALGNVHLRPALEDGGGATLLTMGATSGIRQREVSRVLEVAPDGMPVVIAGDFNEEDRYSACEMLRSIGMKDALAMTPKHTHWWVLPHGNIYLRKRLDHLFAIGDVRWTHCDVLDGYEGNASDHLPVVATFEPLSDECDLSRLSSATLVKMANSLMPGEPLPPDKSDLTEMLQAFMLSQRQ